MRTKSRLALLVVMLAALLPAMLAAQEVKPLIERIEVERIIIDARITNFSGEPILGLSPSSVRITIDKEPVEVEAVDWVPESHDVQQFENAGHVVGGVAPEQEKLGRRFIIFMQTDFARATPRLSGQMAINASLERWLGFLEPEDEVAVFSFDSHLKFRLDFSTDHKAIMKAVRDSVAIDEPPPPPPALAYSLSHLLDRRTMHDVARPEDAIRIVADALAQVPGAKSMIFFCWGLGHVTNGIAANDFGYEKAVLALQRARVTVFSIDENGGHALSFGLKTIANDTGGFYASSVAFPSITMQRLQHTLGGHYEIVIRKVPAAQHRFHTVDVAVPARRDAHILARRVYYE